MPRLSCVSEAEKYKGSLGYYISSHVKSQSEQKLEWFSRERKLGVFERLIICRYPGRWGPFSLGTFTGTFNSEVSPKRRRNVNPFGILETSVHLPLITLSETIGTTIPTSLRDDRCSTQCFFLVQLMKYYGHIAKKLIHWAGKRLRFLNKAFCSNKNLSAGQDRATQWDPTYFGHSFYHPFSSRVVSLNDLKDRRLLRLTAAH